MIKHMNASVLERPTPALVVHYIEQFDQSNAALTDQALTWLIAAFPNNHDAAAVLVKATVINSLYATNIYAIFQVAQHICALNIDPKLAQGSLEVVDEIARITLKGKQKRNYSFATKYCSWHRPEIYPIFDSYVERLLWAYRQQDRFAGYKRGETWHYPRYVEIVEQFRTRYGLSEFGFKELDKFLWQYGMEVFATRSTPNPTPEEAHEHPTHHQLGIQNV
jgi:hypothetical protein